MRPSTETVQNHSPDLTFIPQPKSRFTIERIQSLLSECGIAYETRGEQLLTTHQSTSSWASIRLNFCISVTGDWLTIVAFPLDPKLDNEILNPFKRDDWTPHQRCLILKSLLHRSHRTRGVKCTLDVDNDVGIAVEIHRKDLTSNRIKALITMVLSAANGIKPIWEWQSSAPTYTS